MNKKTYAAKIFRPVFTLILLCCSFAVGAVPINWVDWQSSNNTNGFTAFGTITTSTSTVNVTYNNPQGVQFFQDGVGGGETDYWQNIRSGRNAATSPYTSTGPNGVDNIPTGTDMIALSQAGFQTLSFSEPIANLVFSYISLNLNGYGFDQDFDILSYGTGNLDGNGNDEWGYWGGSGPGGTSTKVFDSVSNQYQLLGTGEPHGTIRFSGAFPSVTWESLSSENWNGFTIGVQGTAVEILPCVVNPSLPECNGGPGPGPGTVPEPGTLLLFGLGLAGLGFARRKKT